MQEIAKIYQKVCYTTHKFKTSDDGKCYKSNWPSNTFINFFMKKLLLTIWNQQFQQSSAIQWKCDLSMLQTNPTNWLLNWPGPWNICFLYSCIGYIFLDHCICHTISFFLFLWHIPHQQFTSLSVIFWSPRLIPYDIDHFWPLTGHFYVRSRSQKYLVDAFSYVVWSTENMFLFLRRRRKRVEY